MSDIQASEAWLLLILTMSGQQSSARIRIWRSLKASGAVALRDGVYLAPKREELTALFEEHLREVELTGGTAFVFGISQLEAGEGAALSSLFDRHEEYTALRAAIRHFCDRLTGSSETESRKILRQLKREFAAISSIDYFPGSGKAQAREELVDAESQFIEAYSPQEPVPELRQIQKLDAADFARKTWATRARPWIDRVASAWLIRRFIDHRAKFIWLRDANECPPNAVGFDFDGAAFTHVGDLVTFEVLLESFDLGGDNGLRRIGEIVHSMDVGDSDIAEAAGLEAILAGARDAAADDDAFLETCANILDHLYAAFTRAEKD